MKKTLLILLSIITFQINAQDYLMQNGSITACSGSFYDSGGEFDNYSDNENFVLTICPETSEQRIKLDFLDFITQQGIDTMIIYDGDNTSETMIGMYSGVVSPGQVVAGFNSPTGCLTIEFVSSTSGNSFGWTADISCTEPCQDITAQLDSTSPVANGEGIIEVCLGDNITLNGSGIFEVDGTGATYEWDLGDGNSAFGQSVTISYNIPGVYLVDLHITDTNTDNFAEGCSDSSTINQIIRVSGSPDFTGTSADEDILCFGESTTIEAVVNPTTLIYNCPPPESEETFLPDGNGTAYLTCINVTCFDSSATLTDISEILDICLNMEHSFSGDLDIKIISPNGQEAMLFEQAGGGTYFGAPIDDDNSNDPGVGSDYCFSMSATTLLQDANFVTAGVPQGNSWEPGTYLPYASFDTLIGSPLNGEWCVEIVDNIPIDNGYIFSWELNFDESITLEDYSFTPEIISQSWDADPNITETNGDIITVSPSTSGEYCFTYRVVDEFNCEYIEEVCITVADENQPPVTYYEDVDGDGYGDANSPETICSSTPRLGFVENDLDCDDTDELVNPDATDDEGDGTDSNCDGVDGVLSVDDFFSNAITIRPNPFNDEIIIELDSGLNNHLKLKIFDINGRIIYDKTHKSINGIITIRNLSDLEKAPYFLNISNSEAGVQMTKKLFKI